MMIVLLLDTDMFDLGICIPLPAPHRFAPLFDDGIGGSDDLHTFTDDIPRPNWLIEACWWWYSLMMCVDVDIW